MKLFRLFNWLLCGSLLGAFPGAAGPLRIVVLSETTIQSDTIFFSHLLPANAAPNVRARGAKLNLGRAPAYGFSRSIDREFLNASLLNANFSLEEFTVPESVTVRREGRVLTRGEVSQAINVRLASGGADTARAIRADEVQMVAPTLSLADDPHLVVTEMSYDRLLHATRFRLSSRTNPQIPPFYAWISAVNGSLQAGLRGGTIPAPAKPDALVNGIRSTGVVLVEPNRMASLYLHSSNLSTLMRVRPLQPGQDGEIIRVRIPKNGKTLRAKVVGTDFVEAIF